jgi:RimJ/RimL family protein N-acetyltransferase
MSESYLRRAIIDDMDILFEWVNDQATRQNAFNTKQITYDEHKQWFSDKLKSDNSVIYIYCFNDTPIGQVRLDIENGCGMISYSIDINHRSQGHGGRILELMEAYGKTKLPYMKALIARVKKSNVASLRIFERLNYLIEEKDGYIEYKKEINRGKL